MRADIGIALDGDADRLMIVDEQGHIVDGDQIMALIGERWKGKGQLLARRRRDGNVESRPRTISRRDRS